MKVFVSRNFIKLSEILLLFLSLSLFLFSLILVYIFKMEQCSMCIIARYTYVALFIFMLFFKKIPYLPLCIAFLGLIVSVYHKLIQTGVFAVCPLFFWNNNSFENFQYAIQNNTPCTVKASFMYIDLVYANIFIFSFYIIFFVWKLFRKHYASQ